MEEKFFSPSEVAKKYSVGRVTVGKWIREGKLRAVKLGGIWRIPESALEEFIRDSRSGGDGKG